MSHKGIRCIVMSYIRVCGLQLVGLSEIVCQEMKMWAGICLEIWVNFSQQ